MFATQRTGLRIARYFPLRGYTGAAIKHSCCRRQKLLHSSTKTAISIQGTKAVQKTLVEPPGTFSAMDPATIRGNVKWDTSLFDLPCSRQVPTLVVPTVTYVPPSPLSREYEAFGLDKECDWCNHESTLYSPNTYAAFAGATREEKMFHASIVGAQALIREIEGDMGPFRSFVDASWYDAYYTMEHSFHLYLGSEELFEMYETIEYLLMASIIDETFVKENYYDATKRNLEERGPDTFMYEDEWVEFKKMTKVMAVELAEFNKANKRRTVTVGGRRGEMV